MRLKLSALFLSTALATGMTLGSALVLAPVAPVAHAQTAGEVDVDSLLKLLPPDVKATYESKSYDSLSGVTTVKNLKIADVANETANFVAIEEVGLSGVDLAAFQHVFDFAKYGLARDETFKQLFGDVSLKNASITMNGQLVGSMESMTSGGVQMKQLPTLPPGVNGTPDDEAEGLKFLGSLLDSFISGPIELTNFTIDAEGNKSSIAKASMGGITRGQFGASSLENFEAVAEGNYAKIASVTGDGGDFSKVLPYMIKGELPPVTADPLLYVGGGKASGLDYNLQGTKVTIAEYTVDPVNFYWLVPATLKLTVSDLVVTPDPATAGAELGELGINHLDLDFGLDWTFDGNAGAAQLKELRIQESQLFDATLSLDLTGIDLAKMVDPATMQMAGMQIGLAQAQLYLKNNGGFDKFLAMAAKEEGKSADQLKQEALAQLSQLEGGMPGPDGQMKPPTERLKGIIAALKSFIQSPGTLTVRMQPASPVTATTGMGAMMDPMSAADTLGLTVESTGQ